MRSAIVALPLLLVAVPLHAQDTAVPSGLAAVERDRSTTCVAVMARLDRLNEALSPLAARSRRLSTIAQAVALEDRRGVEPLDENDPVERRVRDWFVTDAALAQRYVAQPDGNLLAERAAGRETIKATVTRAITDVEARADSLLQSDSTLAQEAPRCEGAIFVRAAVLEACESHGGPLCDEAALPASEVRRYRFVDDPASMWDIEEMRPWTTPGPLRVNATGQLDGARTIGYARIGNVVVTAAFSPLLRNRADLSPEELATFQTVNDSLGLTGSHADLVFTPALGVRAALPQALAGEDTYVVHFGEGAAEDWVWSARASTGESLEATIPLNATQARRLSAGEPLSFTALSGSDATAGEPVFTIGLSNVGQAPAIDALLRYMATQLSTDLTGLIQPRGSQGAG